MLHGITRLLPRLVLRSRSYRVEVGLVEHRECVCGIQSYVQYFYNAKVSRISRAQAGSCSRYTRDQESGVTSKAANVRQASQPIICIDSASASLSVRLHLIVRSTPCQQFPSRCGDLTMGTS